MDLSARPRGHRLLVQTAAIPRRDRFEQREVYDYRYVLHELQLNAWVLAWRRLLSTSLIEWHGETEIEPPRDLRPAKPLRIDGDWSVERLRNARPRLIRPDAVLEVERGEDRGVRTFLEFDRTRRVDKNYEKFRRYDAFLNWWWRFTAWADLEEAPAVLFICQDEEHCRQFVTAADNELTGHHWHPSVGPDRFAYVGRQRILFTVEPDTHSGLARAWRVPHFPPGDAPDGGDHEARFVRLPGYQAPTD